MDSLVTDWHWRLVVGDAIKHVEFDRGEQPSQGDVTSIETFLFVARQWIGAQHESGMDVDNREVAGTVLLHVIVHHVCGKSLGRQIPLKAGVFLQV